MKGHDVASQQFDDAPDGDDLLEMANLFPRTTGLPMTVLVSPRGNARHDVRVKVNMALSEQMSPANTALIGVRPSPHIVTGSLSRHDEPAVFEWIALNTVALVAYWEGRIDTVQLAHDLKPIPGTSGP